MLERLHPTQDEWSWTGSLTDWLLDPGRAPAERDEVLAAAVEHRDGWLEGYRGVLGFASLVLADARTPSDQ